MARHLGRLAAATFGGAGLAATVAHAEYPERSITIIVPFSAGGNTDTIARVAAEHLSEELGQAVVVENRGGGGGTIGSALVANAAPDGYTLLFGTTGTHNVNSNLRDVDYDPVEDFQPISAGVISSVLIVAHPSVEAETLEELIALTSSEEGASMNFGSGGVGTVAHVAGELYNEKTGSQLVHIPYSGAGDVLNDFVAGRVQLNMDNVPSFLPHIEADAVRPLAIAAEERSSLLPDVPTTGEAGLDDKRVECLMRIGALVGVSRRNGAKTTIRDERPACDPVDCNYADAAKQPRVEDLARDLLPRLSSVRSQVRIGFGPRLTGCGTPAG